jgi:hypothetical protein
MTAVVVTSRATWLAVVVAIRVTCMTAVVVAVDAAVVIADVGVAAHVTTVVVT